MEQMKKAAESVMILPVTMSINENDRIVFYNFMKLSIVSFMESKE